MHEWGGTAQPSPAAAQDSVGNAAAWASTPGSAWHQLSQRAPWQQGPSISSRGAGSVNFCVSYSDFRTGSDFLIYLVYFWPPRLLVAVPAFLSCGERSCSWLWCGGFSLQWPLLLQSTGFRVLGASVAVTRGLRCPWHGIFLGQGLDLCSLYWDADS